MRNELIAIAIAIAFPLGVMAANTGTAHTPGATGPGPTTTLGGTSGGAPAPPGPGGGTPGSLGAVGTTGGAVDIGNSSKPRTAQSASGPDAAVSGSLWRQLDTDRNGVISRDEARDSRDINSRFNQLDKDADGVLSPEELSAGARGSGRARTAPGSVVR